MKWLTEKQEDRSCLLQPHKTAMGNVRCAAFLLLCGVLFIEQIQQGYCREAHSNVSCHSGERKALLQFKGSLIDKSNRLSSWTGDDCCTWEGVGCSKINNYVVKLDLRNQFPFDPLSYSDDTNYAANYSKSCLGGELNPSLLMLEHLQYLDLSMNNFSGIQIPWFFGSLKGLRYLGLSSAGFDGMIPDNLGNLSSLQYLNLGDAPLGWTLGAGYTLSSRNLWWVAKLSSLKSLDLSRVYLGETRDWVNAIHMVSSLESLNLAGCELSNIPSLANDHNFTALTSLDLQGNKFATAIPLWLFNLTSLTNLKLAGNLFYGPIPGIISQLASLTLLDLFSNDLTNSLPNSLCNLSSLSYLHLQFNQFQGSIPKCLGKLTSLKELNLNSNKFSGEVPTSLGQLPQLERLVLADNPLNGALSELHFLKLKELKFLRISSTFLSWNVTLQWLPPFQLNYIGMSYSNVGPRFPSWLQTQKQVETLMLCRANISDAIPDWFEDLYSEVLYIDLTENQITGKLPRFKEIDVLDRWIQLYTNKFDGPLDPFPADALVFDVSKNSLTGSIPRPSSISPKANLQFLTLNDNLFTGSIPQELCNLRTLYFLDFSNNQLSGRLPSCLANLPNLGMLNLANNSLSDHIPSALGNMESLLFLHLNNNKFVGELPSSMQNLKNLQILDLGGNNLEGVIPAWIGSKVSDLRILRLQSNYFTGNISVQLCQLSYLQVLNLEENQLEGKIPRCFDNFSAMATKGLYIIPFSFITGTHHSRLSNFMKGRELEYSSNLPFLKSIALAKNKFVGEIPKEIMNLVGLQGLNLSQNSLQGMIPKNIGNLTELESLDLSGNELSGSIPQSLINLDSLAFLNVSFNNLSGPIPSGNQLRTLNDPTSYIGNEGLCGEPLPKNCQDSNKPSKQDDYDHHTGWKASTFTWFYAGLAPGFASGIVALFLILLLKESWRHAYFQFVEDVCNNLRMWILLKRRKPRKMFR